MSILFSCFFFLLLFPESPCKAHGRTTCQNKAVYRIARYPALAIPFMGWPGPPVPTLCSRLLAQLLAMPNHVVSKNKVHLMHLKSCLLGASNHHVHVSLGKTRGGLPARSRLSRREFRVRGRSSRRRGRGPVGLLGRRRLRRGGKGNSLLLPRLVILLQGSGLFPV